jgi:hypothetical protein
MALTTSEVARIKYELGFNVLAVGAEPYIGITALFEQVIQPHTTSGASTTSSTSVTAASTPTPVTLTVASVAGINAGDAVIVDVDSRQERATVQSIGASTITLLLAFAHSGTYPITVEGGESIIRGILQKLQAIDGMSAGSSAGAFGGVVSTVGIKKVDDIEFFGGGTGAGSGTSRLTELRQLREYWRDELASVLGIPRLNGGTSEVSVY